jgi:sulfate adenylyltransferase subunit 1 (EFTu-like GTPase family)
MSVEMHHVKLAQAGPGDIVGLCVRVPEKSLKRGMVCSLAGEAPARACVQFRAQVIVFDQPAEIKVGYTTTLDVHTAHVPCRFAEIECRLARDGSVTEKRPESIRAGDGAIVVLEPLQGVVVETFEDCPPLGRFALRDSQKTVAVGVIKEVTKVDAPEANPVLRGEAPASHLRPPSPRMVPVVRSRGYPADPPAPKPRRSRGPSKNGPEERSKRTEDDEREREDSPEGQGERRRSRKDDSNSRSTRDTSADGADERDREV